MSPDLSAIAEYNKREAEYARHVATLDEITSKRDEARRSHEELKRQRHEVFTAGFRTIAKRLKEMYQMITLGGDAELVSTATPCHCRCVSAPLAPCPS